jgi:hypothetical protein
MSMGKHRRIRMFTMTKTIVAAVAALQLTIAPVASRDVTQKDLINRIVLFIAYDEHCEALPESTQERLGRLIEVVDRKELTLAGANLM